MAPLVLQFLATKLNYIIVNFSSFALLFVVATVIQGQGKSFFQPLSEISRLLLNSSQVFPSVNFALLRIFLALSS